MRTKNGDTSKGAMPNRDRGMHRRKSSTKSSTASPADTPANTSLQRRAASRKGRATAQRHVVPTSILMALAAHLGRKALRARSFMGGMRDAVDEAGSLFRKYPVPAIVLVAGLGYVLSRPKVG